MTASAAWGPAAAILATSLACYAVTLGHGFVFDDGIAIVRNAHVRSLVHLPDIFATTEWAGAGWQNHLYRPLVVTSYALNYALAGLAPWSWHLVNVLLHGLVSILAYRLALSWGLSGAASLVGALVFAAHPVHVEAVANVAGRKELMVSAFVLLVLLTHARARQRGGAWVAVPAGAYAAAMLCKEVGVVAPVLALVQDVLFEDRTRRPTVGLAGGYAFALVGVVALRWRAAGGFGVATIDPFDNPAAYAPATVRLMTATVVIAGGLLLQVLPVTLSPDYSYRAIPLVTSPLEPSFLLALASIAGLLAVAVGARRRVSAVTAAVFLYFVALLPGSNLVMPIGTIFGERLLYLPSVGTSILLGYGLALLARGRIPALAAAAGLVVAVLGARTVAYARAWADDTTLFAVAVRSMPDSTKVQQKRGDLLLALGRAGEAVAAQQRALAIAPLNTKALVGLGRAYARLGRPAEAEEALLRALSAHPGDADALYGLGVLRRDQGRLDEAARLWRTALASHPRHAPSHADLGALHLMRGEEALARAQLEAAVESDPTMASAWYNLAELREARGDAGGARAARERFLATAGPEYATEVARVRRRFPSPSGR